jgi:2-polyprenyl-3-methyl-5-hydroxy-6-metoxy-1,4-benzoquinol methylase
MIPSLLTDKPACLLATLGAGEIAKEWHQNMDINLGDEFRELGLIQYCECRETGLRFYIPAAAAGTGQLYSQLQKYDWYYMPGKWEFGEALSLLEEPSELLEVGVGEGYFLQAAKQDGHSCHGVELNDQAAARVRSLGFEIYTQTLNDLSIHSQKRYDVICSFQVLEHVPDPIGFLRDMIALLNPGGRLVLSVPNAAVMRNIDPKNKDLLNRPPHHMTHWDEKVFHSLPKVLPIEVKTVCREPLASYHVAWIVNGYLRNKLGFAGHNLSRLLVNRYTTLPLQLALKAGLRYFFPGHTLLVELLLRPAS